MMDKLTTLNDLLYGEIDLEGQFIYGSNGTFLTTVKQESRSIRAVYKPEAGEQPLYDFPAGTLSKREVATCNFDDALGWNLVPPTVYRQKAPLGPGSLQLFIPHDPQEHYFQMSDVHEDIRRKVLLFDFMVNNADRKAGHFIVDPDSHVWLIDHGLTFHEEDKLRTVAWDYTGENIPSDLLNDIERVFNEFSSQNGLNTQLSSLLSICEINALKNRMRRVLDLGSYPTPPTDRRIIPWPPI